MPKEQLTLPYEEIQVAGRDFIRLSKDITTGGMAVYQVQLSKIIVREGFNKREVYDGIEELAESIFMHKQKTPFDLDVMEDGRFFIYRGHRRKKAYDLLVSQGRFDKDGLVSFHATPCKTTELERMADQYISNNHHEKFRPMEQAAVANSIKRNFGNEKKNEEVAALMGVSRQTVDNLITIFSATEDLKHEIRIGNMSLNAALSFIRNQKKVQKEADKKELDAAQSTMYVQPFPKDELAGELKELDALDQQAADMRSGEEEFFKQQENDEIYFAKLFEIADVVHVSRGTLLEHLNKKLARDAYKIWNDQFVEEETGEIVLIVRNEVVATMGSVINSDIVDVLVEEGVNIIYVYKKGQEPVAPSVITVAPEGREKDRYDMDRPEIAQVQNCIKLADRIEARINKIDSLDEGTKNDFADWVKWMQKDLAELREWVHKNKKINKSR